MFAEFGPAPLCLELDFDSFDGPPHWVARLRQKSGWLMVAEATIQSEHDMLTDRLVVACDQQENPIPSFKAANLINCDWINPTYCDELPPDILEDLICEEERALVARWHREKNAALAEAFEAQEIRVAVLEARVQSMIARNEAQIAEMRQRRRHPATTPEMRSAMSGIIAELDDENDELLLGMGDTRAAIRKHAIEVEEALWGREDLLVEVQPLHLIRWEAMRSPRYAPPYFVKPRTVQYVPASGRTGGATPSIETVAGQALTSLAEAAAVKAAEREKAAVEPIAKTTEQPKRDVTSKSERHKQKLRDEYARLERVARKLDESIGAGRRNAARRREIQKELLAMEGEHERSLSASCEGARMEGSSGAEATVPAPFVWTEARVLTLRRLWADGQSASTIAKALGGVSRNAVIGKAERLGLTRTRRDKISQIHDGMGEHSVTSSDQIMAESPMLREQSGMSVVVGSTREADAVQEHQTCDRKFGEAVANFSRLKTRQVHLTRELQELEIKSRKFFPGSKKHKRNRESILQTKRMLALCEIQIAKAEERLEGSA